MNKMVVAVALSLLAGLAIGSWIVGTDADESIGLPSSSSLDSDAGKRSDRLARIEQMLLEEQDARMALEDTIAMLFEEIERLEGMGGAAAADVEARAEQERAVRTSSSGRSEAERMQSFLDRRVSILKEGGFSEDEARRILEQESEFSFDAMAAAWEQQRSGEPIDFLSSQFDAQAMMREELGDDNYARYLEAQGSPTAVRITQVLGGSPARDIGLQPGDQLVSYGGERMFSVMELRNRSMEGNPGEDVVIEIERNGTRMQLTVPRGPIGITGSGARVRGGSWWGS